ncbi:MAG TPA: hypothetical protein VNQ73_05875 [Ilumatobacter sp.]|nr:hypothetical protein [Ilumatobacter sp.]
MTATILAGLFDRPAATPLVVAIVAVLAGFGLHAWAAWSTRPQRANLGPPERPAPLAAGPEPAAVVGQLTNGFHVPTSAVPATVLDLAARGWVRLAHADGELMVVTRSTGAATGDVLRAHEQLVLNHLSARAFNDVTSGATLAVAQRRLSRRWFRRFNAAVAAVAQEAGLSTRRYSAVQLGPSAAAALLGAYALWRSTRSGTEIAVDESWRSRGIWLAALAGLIVLVWRTIERARGSAATPTKLGVERLGAWMGYRARLAERIPANASVVGAPSQQEALARAVVMGLSRQVFTELPIVREDPRRAWSEAGDVPHTVRVRYPVRPGYGQHPVKVLVGGLIGLALALWLRRYFADVADGVALTGVLDKAPGKVGLFHGIARWLSIGCTVPIVAALWCVVAGTVDTLIVRQRTGMVVRTRQPFEVHPRQVVWVVRPFGERTGYTTYLAVDDGRRDWVDAWLANERSAAPQGAQAQVRATPLLGFVRSSEPIGTATRR